MTQSDIINNNFNKVLKCIKSSNAYITGEILNEEKGYTQLLKMKRSTFDVSKFTVVGSPVISDDGIASGFDNSNYIQAIQLKHLANKSWVIKTKWINQGKTGTSSVNVFYDMGSYRAWGSISFSTALKQLAFFSRTGTKDDTNNEKAWAVKYLSDIPNYIIASISFDIKTGTYTAKADWGGGEVLIGTYTPTTENKQLYMINNFPDKYVRIGTGSDNEYNKNATDLKQFSVEADEVEIFSGNETGIDVIKPDNYEVVGNPVISNDGVASGFASNNYLKTTSLALKSTDNIKIKGEFTTSAVLNTTQTIINYSEFITVFIDNDKLKVYEYSEYINSQYALETNKKYYFVYTTTNSGKNRKLELFDENNVQIEQIELSSTSTFSSSSDIVTIGIGKNKEYPFLGTINLNTFKIYTNDNLIYQACLRIPYTKSRTGSKIVDSDYRDRVQDVYEQFGTALYYTLDQTNKNFTLPMGEIYGVIEQKDVRSELNLKANLSLNNLSDTGKKVIDGQWVQSVKDISTATAVGTYTIDLADYLPVDDYSYEIYINADAYTGSNEARTYISAMNNDMTTSKITLLWGASYARQNTNIAIVIADKTRKITIQHEQGKWSSFNLKAIGYRRLGTNS